MKKEIKVYLFGTLLIASVFLLAYYFSVGPTGFVAFEQQAQSDFSLGTYENLEWDSGDSIIILSSNQTNGTYTSQIFDANETVVWNNLTFTSTGSLTFEIRSCSSADCSDTSFVSSDLGNLSLSSRYFQYKVYFDSNVSNETLSLAGAVLDYSLVPSVVSASLIEPTGTKDSASNIPLSFSSSGDSITCMFSVYESGNDNSFIANATLENCGNTSFSVNDEGDYILYLYVSNATSSVSDSSSFTVEEPEESSSEDAEDTGEDESALSEETTLESTEEYKPAFVLTLGEIADVSLSNGELKSLTFSVENSGRLALSTCNIVSDNSWVSSSLESPVALAAGQSEVFSFSLNVPEDAVSSSYPVSLSVICAEASSSKGFNLNVIQKTFEFNITSVEKTLGNAVRVRYTLKDLSGVEQNLTSDFAVLNNLSEQVSTLKENLTLDANATQSLRVRIPVNGSLEGEVTVLASLNSLAYSASLQEKALLGASITGLAFLDGGTGNIVIAVSVLVVVVLAFLVIRKKVSARGVKGKESSSVSAE